MNVYRWIYGVTTIPSRRKTYLPKTLASLRATGFDKPWLFVDGELDSYSWVKEYGENVSVRCVKAGAYPNWLLALTELWVRQPLADRFAIFQDDIILVRNLRDYLDSTPYPKNGGYLNLFTYPENNSLFPVNPDGSGLYKTGWHPANQNGKGALALVFDRAAVIQILQHKNSVERLLYAHKAMKSIDGAVVEAASGGVVPEYGVKIARSGPSGWLEYVHHPSLVEHQGDVSAINGGAFYTVRSVSFPGEEFDARELIKASPAFPLRQPIAAPVVPVAAVKHRIIRTGGGAVITPTLPSTSVNIIDGGNKNNDNTEGHRPPVPNFPPEKKAPPHSRWDSGLGHYVDDGSR